MSDGVTEAQAWVANNLAGMGVPGWFIAGALGLAGTAAGAALFISSIAATLSMSSDLSGPTAQRLATINAAKMREMGAIAETWTSANLPALTWAQYLAAVDYEAATEQAAWLRSTGSYAASEALELPQAVNLLRADLLAAIAQATSQQYQATERAAQYTSQATLVAGEAVAKQITDLRGQVTDNAWLLSGDLGMLADNLVAADNLNGLNMRATLSTALASHKQGIIDQLNVGQALNAHGIDSLRTAIEGLRIQGGDVTVQAAPAPNVSVNPTIDTAALGTTLAAAMPAIGVAMAAAISATAGGNAKSGAASVYGCQGGWAETLMSVVRTALPAAATGAILFSDSPVRTWLEDQLETVIGAMTDPGRFTAPATEADALSNATSRLTQAVGYGITAQMMAYTCEAITPLKQMGFNQLAGFVGDLAGFKRIAAGLMGTLEDAAIYQPLKWRAQRQFRPTLPNEMQLALMYQKRSLTRAELTDYQERLGLPDQYIERVPGFIFNDPNPGMLIRAFQLAPPGDVTFSADDLKIMEIAGIDPDDPDAYYKLKFAKSGLDDTDVEAFVPIVKMGLLRREQTLRYDAITRLYRDGYKSRAWAEAELALANAPADRTEYRLAAIDLQRDYKLASDARAIAITAMGRGVITRAAARELLESLGMDAQRVEVEVLKGTLGLLPTQRLTVATEDDVLGEAGVTV